MASTLYNATYTSTSANVSRRHRNVRYCASGLPGLELQTTNAITLLPYTATWYHVLSNGNPLDRWIDRSIDRSTPRDRVALCSVILANSRRGLRVAIPLQLRVKRINVLMERFSNRVVMLISAMIYFSPSRSENDREEKERDGEMCFISIRRHPRPTF